ncbi:response regulator [bacterium]|nr:response regulator [bacterium]
MGRRTPTSKPRYSLSFRERQAISVLVVEPEAHLRQVIRNALQSLGYGATSCVSEYSVALDRIESGEYTHLLYEVRGRKEEDVFYFLERAFELNGDLVAIALSENPQVDEIFEHLRRGTRGFLSKPLTSDMVEESMLQATLSSPFSQVILQSNNRDEAFCALLAASVNKAALAKQQELQRKIGAEDALQFLQELEDAVELVHTFRTLGESDFLGLLVDFFIRLSEQPETRLGSLRKRLSESRRGGDGGGDLLV